MAGTLNSERKAMAVMSPTAVAARLGAFAVFGSVHGYAQSVVVIRNVNKSFAPGDQALESCPNSGATLSSSGMKCLSAYTGVDR